MKPQSNIHRSPLFPSVSRWAALAVLVLAILSPLPSQAHDPEGDLRTDRLVVIEAAGSGLKITLETRWGRLPSTHLLETADLNSNGNLDEEDRSALEQKILADIRRCFRVTGPQDRILSPSWRLHLKLGSNKVGPFGLFARADTHIQTAATGTWHFENHCPFQSAGLTQIQLRPSKTRHFEDAKLSPGGKTNGDLLVLPKGRKTWVLGVRLVPGGKRSAPKSSLANRSQSTTGRLERMAAGSLSFTEALLALLVAFLLGAYHALSPGHGKTLTAAYLVGEQAGVGQAVALAAIVTFTHTFSIALLALGVLLVFGRQVPPWILPYLGAGAGAVITVVGLHMLWRGAGHHSHDGYDHHSHHHSHDHNHDHSHDHNPDHSHNHDHQHSNDGLDHHSHDGQDQGIDGNHGLNADSSSLWRLLTVGISGGLVPCPTALVVLLASLAIGRTLFGLALVASFSLGLASVLAIIGVLVVRAKSWLAKRVSRDRWTRILPRASGLVISIVGLALVLQALR